MHPFSTYDATTGEILTSGFCQLADLARQGECVIAAAGAPDAHYVANGQLVAYTPEQQSSKKARPGHAARWCNATMAWADDRSAEARAADGLAIVRAARAAAYPRIGDQLDSLWKAMRDGTLPRVEPFYSQIEAVKAANPKPREERR